MLQQVNTSGRQVARRFLSRALRILELTMVRKRTTAAQTAAEESAQDSEAALVLDFERKRKRRARRKVRRRRRNAEKQHHAAMERMQQSIEVIKWCILSISTVMVISLITGLVVLYQVRTEIGRVKTLVEHEAERINSEIEEIRDEAEKIRKKIRHPLESLGGMVGSKFDSKFTELLGGKE